MRLRAFLIEQYKQRSGSMRGHAVIKSVVSGAKLHSNAGFLNCVSYNISEPQFTYL